MGGACDHNLPGALSGALRGSLRRTLSGALRRTLGGRLRGSALISCSLTSSCLTGRCSRRLSFARTSLSGAGLSVACVGSCARLTRTSCQNTAWIEYNHTTTG